MKRLLCPMTILAVMLFIGSLVQAQEKNSTDSITVAKFEFNATTKAAMDKYFKEVPAPATGPGDSTWMRGIIVNIDRDREGYLTVVTKATIYTDQGSLLVAVNKSLYDNVCVGLKKGAEIVIKLNKSDYTLDSCDDISTVNRIAPCLKEIPPPPAKK